MNANATPGDSTAAAQQMRIDGVVIGVLVGLPEPSTPWVAFPGNPRAEGIPARTTAALAATDVGREVALLFEGGDPHRPLVIGCIQRPAGSVGIEVDGQRLELSAEREIVLRCGAASITLTRAGKVLIRGTYVLSRSSGVNRIKGGSVQIN